ncbi:MAG: universal stress protein, partial [Rudaea sp.]
MFTHILVPTDGSKLSEKAVKRAMALANQLKARVTALHVRPKSTYRVEMLESTRKTYAAAAAKHVDQFLQFAERAARVANVPCATLQVASDQPYEEIIRTARRKECDLILMASHGRRGIAGFLLGSETQKVLTHSGI